MDNREKAILKTLLYADIFDYPLTKDEIFNYLISPRSISRDKLSQFLRKKNPLLEKSNNYFYLTDRKELVAKREKKKKISVKKLEKAKRIINQISFIPTLEFVGISGALAMDNSDSDDDIDLFVITKKNFTWTSRLLLVFLLTILGVYRNRSAKSYSDKICLNMIIDSSNMEFGKENQDLYTAHEIAQLLPVFNRGKTYQEFIKKNLWVNKFLPNFSITEDYFQTKDSFKDKLLILVIGILFLEKISKFLQLSYMRNHRTKEIVKDGFLKFHPFDYKTHVSKAYIEKIKRFNL